MTQAEIDTLVVTDLDGTFWDHDSVAAPETLRAVRTLLQDPSVGVVAATGRRKHSCGAGLQRNGLALSAILLNGAQGHDFGMDRTFYEIGLANDDLRSVLTVLSDLDAAPVCYRSDGVAMLPEGVTTGVAHLEALGADIEWATRDEIERRHDILGVSMLGVDPELAQAAERGVAAINAAATAAYADSLYPPFSFMAGPRGVTKREGVHQWVDYTGQRPERMIVLGDGGNDLEILAMADHALVPERADPRALELADTVIAGPEHGGWATVLDLI